MKCSIFILNHDYQTVQEFPGETDCLSMAAYQVDLFRAQRITIRCDECRWDWHISEPNWDVTPPELDQAALEELTRVGEILAEQRASAVRCVLNALRNPLAMMSIPTREQAMQQARQFQITAEELLEFTLERAKRA